MFLRQPAQGLAQAFQSLPLCQEPRGSWGTPWNSFPPAAPPGPAGPGSEDSSWCRAGQGCPVSGVSVQHREAAPGFTHPQVTLGAGLAPHSHLCSCPQPSQDSQHELWATAESHHLHFSPSKTFHFSLLPILHNKFFKLGFWCRTW